jgi:putative transcriptional regulator
MICGETERSISPEAILKEAGFNVSERCCSRPSCFDYVARKNSNLILVKIQPDIDDLSFGTSRELKSISECVSAASLLIGEKAREKPLEDDTVYSRYDVLAVTPKTFENIVIYKTHPLIHAGPGGYYVEIYTETIKKRRQQLGLSVGEMAEMIGTSRRTLYGYERGMTKASVIIAYNMAYTLGVPIAKPINVLEEARTPRKCFLTAKFAMARSRLLQKILRRLSRSRIITVKRAPFDFILTSSEESTKIIGAVAGKKEQELDKRVDEILSVSKILKARSVLITEQGNLPEKDITCIYRDEFSKIRNAQDLIAKL